MNDWRLYPVQCPIGSAAAIDEAVISSAAMIAFMIFPFVMPIDSRASLDFAYSGKYL